jgi:hypothetical protein
MMFGIGGIAQQRNGYFRSLAELAYDFYLASVGLCETMYKRQAEPHPVVRT